MSIAAILAVFFQAPLPMDYSFDALKLHVPQRPESPVVKGMEKTWTRSYSRPLPNGARVGGRYDVKIVDHSQDKVKPTEAAILYDFEVAARGDRMPFPKPRDWGMNPTLRTSIADLGAHRLMILLGTQLGTPKAGKQYVQYVVWGGFYADKMAYYYRFATAEFSELVSALASLRAIQYKKGEEATTVDRFPEGVGGEYYVLGAPFLFTADDIPVIVANHEPQPFDPQDRDVPMENRDMRYMARIGGLAGYRVTMARVAHVRRRQGTLNSARQAQYEGPQPDGEVLDYLLWEGGPRRSRMLSVYREISSTASLRLTVDEDGEATTFKVRYLHIGDQAAALIGPDGGDGRTTLTPIRLDKNGLRL